MEGAPKLDMTNEGEEWGGWGRHGHDNLGSHRDDELATEDAVDSTFTTEDVEDRFGLAEGPFAVLHGYSIPTQSRKVSHYPRAKGHRRICHSVCNT